MSFWARVFRARTFRHALPVALILLLLPGPTLLRDPTPRLLLAPAPAFAQTVPPPNPTLLPVATTAHVPLTLAYNAMNVPAKSAGSWYLDPTTNVKIYKLTSATFPTASPNWGHDYSEGGDEVSLPYNGNTRAVLVRQNGGPWWLIDFTPGVGVNNPRQLTGNFAPIMDLAFTFSNNPATPYYAYVSRGGTIYRFDIRTMTEAPGAGWPVTGETSAMWLHQSENDSFFVWMRGANGSTIVGYEPSTTTKKTYTNTSLNEPRIDRAGRYVGLSLAGNALSIWDWQTDTVVWSAGGAIPFAHQASLKRQWLGVNWNEAFPPNFTQFKPDVPNSARLIGKPANGHLIHGNGNWIQSPANLDDQWALFTHYGSLVPDPTWAWLAPGGMIFITANGQRRLLGHPYNTTSNYTFFSFAKSSPDGRYVLLTSDMNGSGRSDVFLAELPTSGATDTTPPTVSLTAPANGATVSGAAVTVAASASDNVGVIGVQFQLDGVTLGTEDTSAPFSSSWNTTLVSNGPHTLTAVARDAAGNTATSAGVSVTVSNADTTPPVLSSITVSSISLNNAAIIWTTNESSDSQVEYGLTASYGSLTALDPTLVTAHLQTMTSLTPGTLFHYRVRSRDTAGNLAVSGDFTFTTSADTTPPSISVTAPTAGATVSGTIAVSASASDNLAVAGVQFKLDSANLGAEDTAAPYTVSLDTAAAANGAHTLTAVARDAAGNTATSATLSVTVSNALPVTPVLIAAVVASSVTSSGAIITWTTNQASDSQVEYGVTMSYGSMTPLNASMVTAHTSTLSGLAAGTLYHYRVNSKDAAGNQGQSADFVFTTTPATADPSPTPGSGDPSASGAAPATAQGSDTSAGGATTGSAPSLGSGTPAGSTATGPAPSLGSGTPAGSTAPGPAQISGIPLAGTTITPTQRIVWTGLVNVTATGNSLKKTSGCDGCADAGAISQQQIAGDGYLEFTASETDTFRLVGLGIRAPGMSRNEIPFGIDLQPGGIAEVRERGVRRTNTKYVRGDAFRIAIVAGTVRYYKNGRLLYISALTPTYPLMVGTSLMSRGATVTNAIISGKLSRGTAAPAGAVPMMALDRSVPPMVPSWRTSEISAGIRLLAGQGVPARQRIRGSRA